MKKIIICMLLILSIISIERNIYQGRMLYKFYKPYDHIVEINNALDSLYGVLKGIIENQEIEQAKFKFDSMHVLLEIREQQIIRDSFNSINWETLEENLGGEE